MTSLGVALAVDARGPSAMYIVTDSRISWSNGGHWDAGQKTFVAARSPDMFGFCGDAFFPPIVIRQIIDQVNCGVLFADGTDSGGRHRIFVHILRQSIERQSGAPIVNFSIFHGARDGEFMQSRFRLWETCAFLTKQRISCLGSIKKKLIEDHFYFVHLDGSGANYVKKRGREWINTNAEGTSRAAIWSFCNTLHQGLAPCSGGAPQLVGVWRKGPARNFGFWWRGKAYLSGSEVPTAGPVNSVDWFNHRFERCNGLTGKRRSDAARHAGALPVSPASAR